MALLGICFALYATAKGSQAASSRTGGHWAGGMVDGSCTVVPNPLCHSLLGKRAV